jgi:aminomethyltransferase
LQGPVSVDFLEQYIPAIRALPYFHHMQTTLFDKPVMISRTGYTGERGYEIFASAKDVPFLWDTILEKGASMGIVPCCFTVLDMLRVESYLLFYPYDNSPEGDSLWELGLDFTVTPGKTKFRGAEKHFEQKNKERVKIFGMLVDGKQPVNSGDEVYSDGKKVGVVTCGMYSELTKQSMAMVRIDPKFAVHGAKLDVNGKSATAHSLPFDDPEKKKRTAKN